MKEKFRCGEIGSYSIPDDSEGIRSQEHRCSIMAETEREMTYELDSHGKILHINSGCKHVTGYRDGELVENPNLLEDMIVPQDRRLFHECLAKVKETSHPCKILFSIMTKEGLLRKIEQICDPVLDDQGSYSGHVSRCRDVTKYVTLTLEDDLRANERSFAYAQHILDVGVWEWNVQTNEIRLSDEVYRILGHDKEEKITNFEAFFSMIHAEDRKRVNEAINFSLTNRNYVYETEFRLARRNGSVKMIHSKGEVTFDGQGHAAKMLGTIQDVTKNKDLEEAVLGRIKFDQFLFKMSSSFISATSENLDEKASHWLEEIVQLMNAEGGSIFLFSEDYSKLSLANSFISPGLPPPPEDLKELHPWLGQQVRQGRCCNYRVLPDSLPKEAGKTREIFERIGMHSYLCVPICEGDRTAGAIALVTFRYCHFWSDEDVRRLKLLGEILVGALLRMKITKESSRLREALSHFSRIETSAGLISGIAHEIKQPLTAIIANAKAAQRFLKKEPLNASELKYALDDIVSDVNRTGHIIDGIRAMVKKKKTSIAPFNLNQVISEIINQANLYRCDKPSKNVEIGFIPEEDLPPVQGDAIQIQQVIMNLITNGIDAMTDFSPSDKRLNITAERQDKDFIKVSVRDTGIGLSDKDKLFAPFYTTKTDGLGMGLSINKEIVEMHGGKIWAENNADIGMTFSFTLPIYRRED